MKNVIVVIAIDDRIAFRAMSENYKKYESHGRSKEEIARDYLGKIIQLPVMLPEPEDMTEYIRRQLFKTADIERVIKLRTKNKEYIGEDDILDKLIQSVHDENAAKVEDANLLSTVTDVKGISDTPQGAVIKPKTGKIIDTKLQMMPETSEDCARFERWTKAFRMKNPRQLLRLRNAYRLLVHFNSFNELVRNDEYLMVLLFWQEYLYNSSKSKAEQLKYELLGSGKVGEDKPNEKLDILEESTVGQVRTAICRFHDGAFNHDRYYQDIEYVRQFVLPVGYTESKIVESTVLG